MSYKLFVYVIFFLLSIFALSGVNFDNFIRTNRKWEARTLVVILSFAFAYLSANFVISFIELGVVS